MFAKMNNVFSLLGDQFSGSEWFPQQASTFAKENDDLFFAITWLCVLFFVPIAGCLFYFALKYKKPKGAKAESNTAHNTPLELAWSILPSFFLVAMFVYGAQSYLNRRTVPDGANEVGLRAQMWNWNLDYGNGVINPELHILVDEPTKLAMRSTDVIHSVFIPAFRAKKDVVPGRYNYMWFEADVASEKVSDETLASAVKENGSDEWDYDKWQFTPDGYKFFDLYCTEYCGKNHSIMQSVVVVHETEEDLNAWIKKVSKRPDDGSVTPAEWGKKLYNQRGCKGCHSLDGSKRVGPSFKESYGNMRQLTNGDSVKADAEYIRNSILEPKKQIVAGYQPVMPSYKGQLSEDDIASITAFLETVSDYGRKVGAEDEGGSTTEEPTEEK